MAADLKGRVALVTGVGPGLGQGIAVALARAGASVVVRDVNDEAIPATRKDVEGEGAECLALRCDITNHQPSWTEPPADCDLDWDGILFLEETGPGRRGCAGDIGASPRAPVLDYGRQISAGGITCRSERTGVTCTNRDGHGIFLSRRQQRIF